ncbi:uncharacterized protein LOC116096594 [Mastomys coucha]|uniref:uncharacterized protein LOC116096594 n=1 Tax=Mastomys coucha TaxID=35658 RepID=UPI00126140DD|nr:uncharacterized protein LOC116096594 [Mastomys coucha]
MTPKNCHLTSPWVLVTCVLNLVLKAWLIYFQRATLVHVGKTGFRWQQAMAARRPEQQKLDKFTSSRQSASVLLAFTWYQIGYHPYPGPSLPLPAWHLNAPSDSVDLLTHL